VLLANPVLVATAQYRPLPASTALGLSAFYLSILTIMCGFLGGTIVNSVADAALGYSTTEIGTRWRQRQPVPINRWQTLLIKWAIIAVFTAVVTAVMLAVAAGALGMYAPHPGLLWLYTWLCAASIGIGTITLFAVAGTYGQLIGLLLFVYAGLASAGGTVPVEALPGFLRAEQRRTAAPGPGRYPVDHVLRRPSRRRPHPGHPGRLARPALLACHRHRHRHVVRPQAPVPRPPRRPSP
jgi:hypothetical protein